MPQFTNSLSRIESRVVAAPSLPARTPIGQAAQFLRLSDGAGIKVILQGEGWGWVSREDVATAARLGAAQTPISRLVGTIRPFPVPRRAIRLTREITPAESSLTAVKLEPVAAPRRGQLRPASRLVPEANRGR